MSLIARPAISCQSGVHEEVVLGLRKSLKKTMVYLLGVVDEYWAMREPGQYGDKEPECSIPIETQRCGSESAQH